MISLINPEVYDEQTKKFKTMWSLEDLNDLMYNYQSYGMHRAAEAFDVTTETVVRLAQKFGIKIKKDVMMKAKKELKINLRERKEAEEKEQIEQDEKIRENLVLHYFFNLRMLEKNKDKSDEDVMRLAKEMLDFRPN